MSTPEQWLLRENASNEDASQSPSFANLTFDAGPVNEENGSSSRYVLSGFNAETNPAVGEGDNKQEVVIIFQNGVLPEVGVNGVTPELLIDVLIHKFEGFQSGKFACEENEQALTGLRSSKAAIQSRLNNRQARGVEGTYEK